MVFPYTAQAASYDLRGCFKNVDGLTSKGTWMYQSAGHCSGECKDFAVMAMKKGNECYCTDRLPPKSDQTDDDDCDTSCVGFPDDDCTWWFPPLKTTLQFLKIAGKRHCANEDLTITGGGDDVYSFYYTGNKKPKPQESGSSTSSATSTSTTSASKTTNPPSSTSSLIMTTSGGHTVYVTPTTAPDNQGSNESNKSGGGTNKAAIAAGVVVGVVGLAAIIAALMFWMKRRNREKVEEEYRRNAQLSDYVSGGAAGAAGRGDGREKYGHDQRLDPSAQRRLSNGSIADDQDYSRKILQVGDNPYPLLVDMCRGGGLGLWGIPLEHGTHVLDISPRRSISLHKAPFSGRLELLTCITQLGHKPWSRLLLGYLNTLRYFRQTTTILKWQKKSETILNFLFCLVCLQTYHSRHVFFLHLEYRLLQPFTGVRKGICVWEERWSKIQPNSFYPIKSIAQEVSPNISPVHSLARLVTKFKSAILHIFSALFGCCFHSSGHIYLKLLRARSLVVALSGRRPSWHNAEEGAFGMPWKMVLKDKQRHDTAIRSILWYTHRLLSLHLQLQRRWYWCADENTHTPRTQLSRVTYGRLNWIWRQLCATQMNHLFVTFQSDHPACVAQLPMKFDMPAKQHGSHGLSEAKRRRQFHWHAYMYNTTWTGWPGVYCRVWSALWVHYSTSIRTTINNRDVTTTAATTINATAPDFTINILAGFFVSQGNGLLSWIPELEGQTFNWLMFRPPDSCACISNATPDTTVAREV